MYKYVQNIIHKFLDIPFIFEWQQKICNNYSAVRKEFIELQSENPFRVVDIGCSTGSCSGAIIDMSANEYYGLDIDSNYISTASKRFPLGKFISVDARNSGLTQNYFDLAMFVGVMHHMNDELVRDTLAEVKRILKAGGRVLVAEPIFNYDNWLSTFLLKMDRGEYIRDKAGYERLFDGFTIDRKGEFSFSAHRFCSYVLTPSN